MAVDPDEGCEILNRGILKNDLGKFLLAAAHGGPYNPSEAQYADVNGDGKADLIYQGTDNRVWASLSTGSSFAPPVLVANFGGSFVAGSLHV